MFFLYETGNVVLLYLNQKTRRSTSLVVVLFRVLVVLRPKFYFVSVSLSVKIDRILSFPVRERMGHHND